MIASGARLLFSSGPSVAPLFIGVEAPDGERIGVNGYVFHANKVATKNRPSDEHRAQIRYGDVNSKTWRESGHPLGFDPAGMDLASCSWHTQTSACCSRLIPSRTTHCPSATASTSRTPTSLPRSVTAGACGSGTRTVGTRKGAVEPGLETIVAFKARAPPGLPRRRAPGASPLRRTTPSASASPNIGAYRAAAAGSSRAGGGVWPLVLRHPRHHRPQESSRDGDARRRRGAPPGPSARRGPGGPLTRTRASRRDRRISLSSWSTGAASRSSARTPRRLYADGTPKVEVQKTEGIEGRSDQPVLHAPVVRCCRRLHVRTYGRLELPVPALGRPRRRHPTTRGRSLRSADNGDWASSLVGALDG